MSALSNVATVLIPNDAATREHRGASLVEATASPPIHCSSMSFAADVDGAEKGRLPEEASLSTIKRSLIAKFSSPPSLHVLTGELELAEGSSTGVDVCVQSDHSGPNAQQLGVDNKGNELILGSFRVEHAD